MPPKSGPHLPLKFFSFPLKRFLLFLHPLVPLLFPLPSQCFLTFPLRCLFLLFLTSYFLRSKSSMSALPWSHSFFFLLPANQKWSFSSLNSSFLFFSNDQREGTVIFVYPIDLGSHPILSELNELKNPLNSKTLLNQILLSWNNWTCRPRIVSYILAILICFSSLFPDSWTRRSL